MGFYRPCTNCVRETQPCARRAQIAAGIRGLGLTSVKFRCAEREPLFTPGQRVGVTWNVPTCDDPGYEDWMHECWPATVIAERGTKFQILVDDVNSDEGTPARSYIKSDTLHCKVTTAKLKALNEPARSVCVACGVVRGLDGSLNGCWAYDREAGGGYAYTPPGCLKAFTASVGRNPEGQDPQGLGAQHEHAVPSQTADAQPTGIAHE